MKIKKEVLVVVLGMMSSINAISQSIEVKEGPIPISSNITPFSIGKQVIDNNYLNSVYEGWYLRKGPGFKDVWVSDKKVKAGFKTFTYCGYWSKKSKSPNGSGTIWYRGDFVYQGDFVNGNRTGKGKYTWGDGSSYEGDVYEGDFVNGIQTGKGKYTWADGEVYEGDWVNGNQTGKGKKTWANGDVYEGDWVDDNQTGKGKYTWADGEVYEGDWVNGNRTGKGKKTWASGAVYEGDFVDGNRTGKGKYTWASGNVYEGDFVDDIRTGKGKYTWASGAVYEGDFVDGKRTGKGKYTWASGAVYEGDFVDGKRTGKGKKTWANGDVYEEDLVDGGFEGIVSSQTVTIGTQVWMTKNLDVATFRNGDPIPQAKTDEEWEKSGENQQPAWCYIDSDPANGAKYGKLYNWYAVNDSRGLAPEGYHIPSDTEWTQLDDFLASEAGKKMKSTSGWESYTTFEYIFCSNCRSWNDEYRSKVPCHTCQDRRILDTPEVTKSGNGTNTSGFSGLPCGNRKINGTFVNFGYYGVWWSSTKFNSNDALTRFLLYKEGNVYRSDFNKRFGFSVRCLRD